MAVSRLSVGKFLELVSHLVGQTATFLVFSSIFSSLNEKFLRANSMSFFLLLLYFSFPVDCVIVNWNESIESTKIVKWCNRLTLKPKHCVKHRNATHIQIRKRQYKTRIRIITWWEIEWFYDEYDTYNIYAYTRCRHDQGV